MSTGLDEFSFEIGQGNVHGFAAGTEQDVATGGNAFLMTAKNFPQPAFGAIAQDGVADGDGGGDDAQSLYVSLGANRIGQNLGRRRALETPESKGAAIHAASFLSNSTEIALAPQMLLGAKAHGSRGCRRAAARRSDNRQALATLQTTSLDHFTATGSGHARAVTNLTGALFAVWTECRLHDF
jgi:hypothetical protein